MSRHAARFLYRQHTLSWDTPSRLPLTDGCRANAKKLSQTLLAPGGVNGSLQGSVFFHETQIRSNLIFRQQGKPNFIAGII